MALSLEYIAGFIDGEGCITLTKRHKKRSNGAVHVEYQPVLVIVNTNRPILEEMQRVIGGSVVLVSKGDARCKTSYALRLGNRQCYDAIKELRAFLILKRQQANLVLKYRQMKGMLRYGELQDPGTVAMFDRLLAEFRDLNHRGTI